MVIEHRSSSSVTSQDPALEAAQPRAAEGHVTLHALQG